MEYELYKHVILEAENVNDPLWNNIRWALQEHDFKFNWLDGNKIAIYDLTKPLS